MGRREIVSSKQINEKIPDSENIMKKINQGSKPASDQLGLTRKGGDQECPHFHLAPSRTSAEERNCHSSGGLRGGVEKGTDTSKAMVLEVSSDSGLYRRNLGKSNDIGVNTLVVVIIKEKNTQRKPRLGMSVGMERRNCR